MATQHLQSPGGESPLAAAGKELNARVDCADLALRLGFKRPGGKGSFENPHHPDRPATLACYAAGSGKGSKWKDFRTEENGGPIDLLMLHSGLDFTAAVKELASMYGVTIGSKPRLAPVEKSRAEFIADNCLRDVKGSAEVLNYLVERGIAPKAIEHAIARGTLGLNLYNSKTAQRGEVNWGGPAAAFVVRSQMTGQVVAVDMRYFNPADNGGVKTQSQGEKAHYPWCSDWRKLEAAKTVYVVESSINALSIESCELPGTAVVSLRGTGNVDTIDWTFLRGKQVLGCLDNDMPFETGPNTGYCAGLKAFWRLHEVLTGLDISCLMVDAGDWVDDDDAPINDINDYLKLKGVDATAKALRKLQDWLIPGMVGNDDRLGKPRLYLPHHDYMVYWKYRVQPDFTKMIGKTTKDEESGEEKHDFGDVCGFRVAAVARVSIASDESTMTGNKDNAPTTMFALSVQTARHGPVLQRVVVDDERLHNIEVWKKLGPVYAPTPFSRMVNVWERAASIGARDAINFVGLAWRDGRLALNEGTDCFFTEPTEQCPYYNLTFPSGTVAHGVEVLRQFQGTFADNEAAIALVWTLGAHLKAFLGYWPHFVIQAEKGAGKSAVVKAIGTAVAMKQFSRQTLQSEYRIIGSVSYTSQPVAWGEFSTNKQELRTKAVGTLQESYQYESTSRGIGLKRKFLMSAPVLLSGEDVPVDGLEGKIARSTLTKEKRGPMITPDCPMFPMRQWIQWLAVQDKRRVLALHEQLVGELQGSSLAKADDAGAERMVNNYAGVAMGWHLLCAFLDIHVDTGGFLGDLTKQMNLHIAETKATRHPWVWIIEKLLSEIARGEFRYPFKFDFEDEVEVLCIRTGHIMDHMSQSSGLRAFWDELPIKSDRALKKQLGLAGVLMVDLAGDGEPMTFERTVHGKRVGHMVGISLPMLRQYGLHAVVPMDRVGEHA
ncbi:toprim domain-containing protein [Rhodoferax sp. WC2427]|uniref:toprim domain-containing protein n=1 Tax=Rhodoferax sp. WC2427 TaxID=3234144 RepID=UPI003465B51B